MAQAAYSDHSTIETDSAEDCPFGVLNAADAALPGTSNDDDFRKFIDLMPHNLQVENYDVLIICSHEDIMAVETFSNHLSNDVKFKHNAQMKSPKVKIMDDIRGNGCDSLDSLLHRSTFTFLYITASFLQEEWSNLLSNACLMRAINDKKQSVIPVFSNQRFEKDPSIPTLLSSIKPINYFDVDQFYKDSLKGMFSKSAAECIKRDVELDKKRQLYYNENKIDLILVANRSNMSDCQIVPQRRQTLTQSTAQYEGERSTHNRCLIESDGPVCRRNRNAPVHHAPVHHAPATNNESYNLSNTLLANPVQYSLHSNENNCQSFTPSMNLSRPYDPATNNGVYNNTLQTHSSQSSTSSIICNSQASGQSFSSQSYSDSDSLSVQAPLSENGSNTFSSRFNNTNSCSQNPRRQSIGNSSVSELPNIPQKSDFRQKLLQSINMPPDPNKSVTIYIETVHNVNVGEGNTTNVHVNSEVNDDEDDTSSSDISCGSCSPQRLDDIEVSRPPSEETVPGASASNLTNTNNQGNIRETSRNLIHPVPISSRDVDESEDRSTLQLSCNPHETFVKYTKN